MVRYKVPKVIDLSIKFIYLELVFYVNKFFAQIGCKIRDDINNLNNLDNTFSQLDEGVNGDYDYGINEFQL